MKKEAPLKERNKLRMCEYRVQLSERKKMQSSFMTIKWEQKSNQVNISTSIPSYKNVL